MAAATRPESVLRGFGVSAAPEHLTGGRGTAWRGGGIILKPLDMSEEALVWQADVLAPIAIAIARSPLLRLVTPRRAVDGALVVEGWTAWPRLVGARRPGSWDEIIEAGARFAELTAVIPRPAFLAARRDPWARADHIAWREHPTDPRNARDAADMRDVPDVPDVPDVRDVRDVAELFQRLGPLGARSQFDAMKRGRAAP